MSFFKVNIFKTGFYLVLFDANGKQFQKQFVRFKDKNQVLPTLQKEYFEFMGWQLDNNETTKATFKTVANINPFKLKTIELYPLFKRQTAYIIYHGGDSPVLMNEDIVACGENVKLTRNTLTKPGHHFLGWSTKSTGRDVAYSDEAKVFVKNDIELYPVWYAYKLVYKSNLERKTKDHIEYVMKGQLVKLKVDLYKEPGHTFLGWDIKSEAEYPKYRGGQNLVDITKDKEVTLYAIWEVKLNRVSFDANGGNGLMKAITTPQDQTKLPKTTFYKSGFLFNGWLLKQTAKTPKYQDQAVLSFQKSGEEITLYALWKLIFDEDYFGITKKMTKEEKLRILTQEYTRYNRLIISNNPERKQEAKAVIESISALRLIIKGT